jgi:opacity protein-like surface antigen
MKRFLAAIALACAFSVSALAGDVPTSGAPSPQASGTTTTSASSLPGDVPTSGYAEQVSDTALSALLTVLGLVVV